jgi:carboxypeptidase Q
MGHAKALEDIAYRTPKRNRAIGTKGHEDTVKYIVDQFKLLGDYYNVTTQPFQVRMHTGGSVVLTVNGENKPAFPVGYSVSGNLTGDLVHVENGGCNLVRVTAYSIFSLNNLRWS